MTRMVLTLMTELLLTYNKLDYGIYWFGVCFREWYDTVVKGSYDDYKDPSWDFFNHINCNYPLEYRFLSKG